MTDRVIEDAGDADFTLVVTDSGAVEARKQIPFDGVLYFSTEARPNRPDKNSEYGLDVDDVIDRYRRRAATQTPRPELAEAVARALRAVREEHDGEAIDR